MNASPALLRLRKDEVRRLRRRGSRGIAVFKGEVWLTRDGDRRDIILTAGESRDFEVGADLVVQALMPSTLLQLDDPRHDAATTTIRERFVQRIGAYGLVRRRAADTTAGSREADDHGARA
jgi:hypothetical protein